MDIQAPSIIEIMANLQAEADALDELLGQPRPKMFIGYRMNTKCVQKDENLHSNSQ